MPTVRKTRYTEEQPQKEVLFVPLSDGLLEQSSGTGLPQGLLCSGLQVLRQAIPELWECPSEILLSVLL